MVMAEIDTAAPVAEATADVEVQAPPSDVTPETDAPESPETEQPAAPETESPSPLSLLDDVDEDALLEHPKVKGILARREESARRRAEHEASQARAQADAEWVAKRGYVDELQNLLARGVQVDESTGEPRLSLDTKALETFTDRLNTTNVRGLVGAISSVIDSKLGKDFNLSADETTRLRDLYGEFLAAPRQKAGAYLEMLLDVHGRAAVEAQKAQIEKDVEKRLRKEFESKAEAEKRRAAEAAAKQGGSPTAVNGSAPGNYDLNTVAGIMRAKRDGAISESDAVAKLNALH